MTPEETERRIETLEDALLKTIWAIRHGTFINKGLADLTWEGRGALQQAENMISQTQKGSHPVKDDWPLIDECRSTPASTAISSAGTCGSSKGRSPVRDYPMS